MEQNLTIAFPTPNRVELVGKQTWMIGRGRGNDINIDHASISRRHAMLQIAENGDVYLVDCGSRNGSFLNGFRVPVRVKLGDGDQLLFGEVQAEFHCTSGGADRCSEIRTIAGTMSVQQRRLMSVLVVDIRDFTVLSRQIGEEMLAEMMGMFFGRAGEVIRARFCRMEKFIGDAVMAGWFHDASGGPESHMARPFEAMLDLYRVTRDLNEKFKLPFPLRIGAGLNTGYAMVGNTGSAHRADYTALGDTVNVAFRLESATKTLGKDVAIGELTHQRLLDVSGGLSPFKPETVDLKGFGLSKSYTIMFSDLEAFFPALTPRSPLQCSQ